MGIGEIFDVLRAWWAEYGESKKLIDAACVKLSLDRTAGQIYLRCPELIPVMERLRHGEPVSRLKVTMSEEGRRWWHALLVVDVLRKCSGVISHVRLVRWLGHRADAVQVIQGMTGAGLDVKLQDAYGFIINHYASGDRIYLF